MYNDQILDNYGNLRGKIDAIVSLVNESLLWYEASTIKTFISTTPANESRQNAPPLNFSFYSTATGDLLDYFSTCKADNAFDGFSLAGKCFLNEAGIECEREIMGTISSSLRMGILYAPQIQTTIYLIQDNADNFESYYSQDEEYFNYLLGEGLSDPELNSGFKPFPDNALLTYYFLRYCGLNPHNVFVILSSGFNYHDRDFALEAKNYIKRTIELTLESIHATGAESILDHIDIVPYDLYFSQFTDKSNVAFFMKQIEECTKKHALNVQNIGKLITSNKDKIIDLFAFSSNYHIGTQYVSSALSELEYEYAHFPKPIFNTSKYKDPRYTELFSAISSKASHNLSLLQQDHILKCLITSEWLYSNIGHTEGFDNTFVCFGYLKLVEMLLSTILIHDYSGLELSTSPTRSFTIEENTRHLMMLGNMIHFLLYNPASPICNSKYWNLIKQSLNGWKNQIRNGYFHKDILDYNDVLQIRNKTFEVIYIILGTIPKQ